MLTIIIAVLVFGLIIFIHELGHFVAAKLSGVTVYRFSIGFGPALIKKEYKGTLYALRLLPLGGSVMMKGEYDDEGNEVEDKAGSFNEASIGRRFIISFAGSFMNFLMGLVLLVITLSPMQALPTNEIVELAPGFEATGEAGLMPGDVIKRVNGMHIFINNDITTALEFGKGEPYDIKIDRNGKTVKLEDITIEKKPYETNGEQVERYGFSFGVEEATFFGKLEYAGKNSISFLQSVTASLGQIFKGNVSKDDVMGTVGIATEISTRAKSSMADMWYFVAFLSINLSLMNLLPIPGLDGGKIFFMLIELIRGKPLPPKYEGAVQIAGLVLIFGLFIFITFNDIMRLFA